MLHMYVCKLLAKQLFEVNLLLFGRQLVCLYAFFMPCVHVTQASSTCTIVRQFPGFVMITTQWQAQASKHTRITLDLTPQLCCWLQVLVAEASADRLSVGQLPGISDCCVHHSYPAGAGKPMCRNLKKSLLY